MYASTAREQRTEEPTDWFLSPVTKLAVSDLMLSC